MAGGAKVPKFRKITKAPRLNGFQIQRGMRKEENTKSDSFIHLLNSLRLLKKILYAVW